MAPDGPSARLPAGLSRPLWRRLLFGPARLRAGRRVLLFILHVVAAAERDHSPPARRPALSLFGAPNTGNQGRPVSGHLLDGTFSGPDWLTGGVRGVEASGLVFIVIAAMFGLFHLRHREVKYPMPRS